MSENTETSEPTKKPFSKTEAFEKWVAFSTSFIAVALALSSILSNQAGDDLLVNRDKASSEWSRFQSKSIKQNLFEVQLEELKVSIEDDNHSEKYRRHITQTIAFFEQEIKRYDREKSDIAKEAKKHEKVSDNSEKRGNVLDLAEAFYQIAIVLSAIALIARQGSLWILSMILGFSGIVTTIVALTMP
jgi:uncharacterized membrane protein YdbT with pleckstrin-like domain